MWEIEFFELSVRDKSGGQEEERKMVRGSPQGHVNAYENDYKNEVKGEESFFKRIYK